MSPDPRTAWDHKTAADEVVRDASIDEALGWIYLRRLRTAMDQTLRLLDRDPATLSALMVCGGIGGGASYVADRGFGKVTNSDFAEHSLRICAQRDDRLLTRLIDLEANDVPDGAYDVVVVHDGLHHLTRPVAGLNEMIRIAGLAVVVVEPHLSLVGRVIGQQWEQIGDVTNYVFRWDHDLFAQTARSQLVREPTHIWTKRLWDHNQAVRKLSSWSNSPATRVAIAKAVYGALTPVNRLGNSFLGVLVK